MAPSDDKRDDLEAYLQRLEKIDLGNDWKETNGELC